ncbi:MAG: glycosyltransferase family 2 protein [Chthoniobacterales bacterium]
MSDQLQRRFRIAALVPAHQEATFIREVVSRSLPFVDKVLVVDDGSTDLTASEAASAGAEVIRLPVNRGKGMALKIGLRHLIEHHFEHVVILDGDLQHLPEEIECFTKEIQSNNSPMIVGSRAFNCGKMPLVRKTTNKVMTALINWLCGQSIDDTQCGFRSMRTDTAQLILNFSRTDGYDFESEMLLIASRQDCCITNVSVSTIYGTEVSKINPLRDTLRFLRLVRRWLFENNLSTTKPTAFWNIRRLIRVFARMEHFEIKLTIGKLVGVAAIIAIAGVGAWFSFNSSYTAGSFISQILSEARHLDYMPVHSRVFHIF